MKKIIVVDDDPDIIFSIKEVLENDFEIISADSGKQLFKTLETNIPDLILLDIMMPEMSGWEVINKIRDNPKWNQIPIIIVSARDDPTAKNAGSFYAEDYILKPFLANELKESINKVL
jgi:two-component system alkaline phosphatase synthesis response regulator PhoP